MEDKAQYWIEISDYDLETAKAMLQSKRYLCKEILKNTKELQQWIKVKL
jgi:hypothetical protein